MEYLLTHHIFSIQFHNLLYEYLHGLTDHFIHEFSMFMKSPYDMIAYDRNVMYSVRSESPLIDVNSEFDNDSDITMVPSPSVIPENPFQTPVLEVIEINSDSSRDSDVIIREPTPPVVVDLLDSDTDENANVQRENGENLIANDVENVDEANRKPILPLKIRLKHRRQWRDKKSKRKRRESSSVESSSSESSSSVELACKRRRVKKKQRKSRYRCYKIYRQQEGETSPRVESISPESSEEKSQSDSEDDLPLSSFITKEKTKPKRSRKRVKSPIAQTDTISLNSSINQENSQEFSSSQVDDHKNFYLPPQENDQSNNDESFNYEMEVNLNYTRMDKIGKTKNETRDPDYDQFSAGPSSGRRLRSVIIKKERNSNLWYSRPRDYYSSDSFDE